MRKIIFKKIKFVDLQEFELEKLIKKRGLFLFPSGPGLSTIEKNKEYHKALQNADYVFFDSGYFVILLKFLKKVKVKKISGFIFFKFFINYLFKNKNLKIFSVDPNNRISKKNLNFFLSLGLKKKNLFRYVAPYYSKKRISDLKLARNIKKANPDYILINIGGGVQEVLGYSLKNYIGKKFRFICTGAAISFFTGDQAPLSRFIDSLYLGWFLRIIYNPRAFFFRYLKAFSLLKLVQKNNIKILKL